VHESGSEDEQAKSREHTGNLTSRALASMIKGAYENQRQAMTEQKMSGRTRAIISHLAWTVVSGLMFGLSVSFATRRYLVSFVTGLAMSSAIEAAYLLDRMFLQPRLKTLPYDWLRFGLEIAFSLLEHVGGALLALFACSWLFNFSVWDTRAWWAVGGMLIGFPIIHGTETALRFRRQLRERERNEEQLRALATQAELKALKAQINPHFLFNTLNTIAQLIHADSAQAEATLERVAGMFRYMLAGSERGLVPLEEEFSFVGGYLEIERARFGERLRVTREVAPEALSVPVPSLILQPLVENAVRHGWGADGSVDLTIRVQPHGDEVVITIADRGPGMPSPKVGGGREMGEGHGLRNVDERLRKTYGEAYGLEITANEPRGAVVTIRIPIEGQEE
jgi:signal transduction histidine kinase